MPDTKPDLSFDSDGVCDACINFSDRKNIDWKERKANLLEIIKSYKNESNWDCIVPVSGGKDSTYQVLKMLQLGIKPLCVTATTCDLSSIGRKNIENIKNLGVDYIEFSTNPSIRKKLNRIGLEEVGDISWPEHVSIFTIPVRVAVNYKIPLIVWGENSQNEYGGPAVAKDSQILNRQWLEEFGGMLGLRTRDISDSHGIDHKDLFPYIYPSDQELEEVGVSGIFLGYFIPWDGLGNALISKAWGFSTNDKVISGSMVDYENLDNYQTGIHDYFKYLKFGFGRASDIVSMHIRRNRITREDAMEITHMHDGKYPFEYLGKTLEEILKPLNMSIDEFDSICERFTNKQIFKLDENGNILKDENKRPIKLSYDN
tara:strand:- start:1375 stop:2490 length:1116 start_codon:yes stop_codon:yes gene_type:complete